MADDVRNLHCPAARTQAARGRLERPSGRSTAAALGLGRLFLRDCHGESYLSNGADQRGEPELHPGAHSGAAGIAAARTGNADQLATPARTLAPASR